jgi:hypothetical protein
MHKRSTRSSDETLAAGNGLLDRRRFLAATSAIAGAMGSAALPAPASAQELSVDPWMKVPGAPFVPYGQPSRFEEKVVRTWTTVPGTTGTGTSRTPHHLLNGMITPNGLHFERHHSGIPDINPDTHRLLIHGLVKRQLIFTLENLARYPMESRIAFIECGWLLAEGADETSKYTITLADGKSLQFVFPQEGKSVITHPSPSLVMKGPGLYEISGIAWSGYGKIAKVEISADGGRSWAQAALQEPVLSKAVTRFRLPWRWNGGPAILQSRAVDDTGYVQPTREQMIALRGNRTIYHSNAITTWSVSDKGEVKHAYA